MLCYVLQDALLVSHTVGGLSYSCGKSVLLALPSKDRMFPESWYGGKGISQVNSSIPKAKGHVKWFSKGSTSGAAAALASPPEWIYSSPQLFSKIYLTSAQVNNEPDGTGIGIIIQFYKSLALASTSEIPPGDVELMLFTISVARGSSRISTSFRTNSPSVNGPESQYGF